MGSQPLVVRGMSEGQRQLSDTCTCVATTAFTAAGTQEDMRGAG